MIKLRVYYGKVTSIKDPDEKGKIQVRLLPEFRDIADADLPWVRPFMNEGTTSFNPPPVDKYVLVAFTDCSFQVGFYITGAPIDGLFDFDKIKDSLSSIKELGAPNYSELNYQQFPDGTITFHNTVTGESGIYHSTGSYTVIDKDGSLISYTKKSMKLYTDKSGIEIADDGTITLDNQGTKIEVVNNEVHIAGNTNWAVTWNELVQFLIAWASTLDAHPHIDPLTGVTGPPSTPTFSSTLSSNQNGFKTLKIKTS